ncbi:LPD38 domain-containing protein [Bacillus infantis]|uniref:LPD38 domain-containing protein n=1 Tax=Bacillus infantis TaxID=324767 RepID=UPI003CF98F27
MPSNFDRSKYKQLFESRFGSGSYDSGLSAARKLGETKVKAEIAKDEYQRRMKELEKQREAALKEAEEREMYGGVDKKTFEARLKEQGKITDQQQKAQDQGRGGHLPTRENQMKEKKKTDSAKVDFSKLTPYQKQLRGLAPKWDDEKEEKSKKKKKKDSPSLLSDLGAAGKAALQFFNPFDKVSGKEAVDNYLNRKTSKAFDESARFSSRALDSLAVKSISNLDKQVNDRTPSYTSKRKFGEGGGLDMVADAAGYLVPGVGAYKLLNASKAGKALTTFGSKGLTQRIGSEAAKGAITGAGLTGAEVGIREGLNPEDYSLSDNLKYIGLGTAAGAIADPALFGAGKLAQSGLSRFAKGEVPRFSGGPSENVLGGLPTSRTPSVRGSSDSYYDNLLKFPEPAAQPQAAAARSLDLPEPDAPRLRAGRDYEPINAIPDDGGPLLRGEPIDRTPMDIQNPKEIVKRQINKDGKREKTKWSFDKAYTAWIDDLRPLEKATKQLGGKDLPITENPYVQARLARGVAGKAETYLRGGIYTPDGQKVGKSLQEIIKPVEDKLDDFLAYSTSKRALDYDQKGLTAGIKPKDVEGFNNYQLAEATIRQIETESPEIQAVHQELVNYNNTLMDELVGAGVLSRESVESIREQNPNYIPMFRVQEPKVRGFEPLTNPKRTFANLGEPVKKRTGSEREIVNPIESIVKNTYLLLNMAERNKVGSSLLDLVEQADNNMWGRVVNKDKGMSVDDIGQTLDEANAQLNTGNAEAVDNLFKGEGNKVYVYKDGERVEMELQEDLYKAMLSLDAQKQNFFINLLGVPTRALRTGAVLSPDFGPVNIFRDQLSALINSKYGFIPFVDMARGLKSVLKQDEAYHSWKTNGGANSVLSTLDREYLQQDLRKLVKQTLQESIRDRAKTPLRTLLEPLRKVSEITEEATRVGEFKKGLRKGATPKEAAFASRDLIDFSRAGTLGRQYNQITAFFNAAVQSMDKLARTFKDKPVQSTVKAMMGVTLPSVVAYYYNKDQEWYKEIPQKERDLFWHFQAGDQVYKLPKPFEAGIIFGTSFERFLDFLETDDPAAFEEFGKTVRDAFTPSWIPTAVSPWIEVYANKSMYFKSPIVPRREQELLPEDQYGPYQSELSKFAGKLTEKSPRKIEHVFKGYTGGLGKYALQMSDLAAEGLGKEKPELPDRGLADKPIINRFIVKNLEGNNQSVNDFYKRMDELKRLNMSAKKNNPAHVNSEGYQQFNQLSGDISELQKMKREIIDDPVLDGKQKAEQIKRIDLMITQIAKVGLKIPE